MESLKIVSESIKDTMLLAAKTLFQYPNLQESKDW